MCIASVVLPTPVFWPDRSGHLGRCQQARRNLIEQRLKDAVVTPIDRRHIGITAAQ
jgi:hypothetical protein